MLNRQVVKEFLDEELREVEVPEDISKEAIVETFCKYTEDDYYEWLKDNYRSFFQPLSEGGVDWDLIKERIKNYSRD